MKQEIFDILSMEAKAKAALDKLVLNIGSAIRNAEPMKGVEPLSKKGSSTSIVTVQFSSLSGGQNLSAEFYIQDAQADAVVRRLSGMPRVTDAYKAIQEMVKTKRVVRRNQETVALNEKTLSILRQYVEVEE